MNENSETSEACKAGSGATAAPSGQGKKCLFIQALSGVCRDTTKVKECLAKLGIEFNPVEWRSTEQFAAEVNSGKKYDFIYLAAHADGSGFGERDGTYPWTWQELAREICRADCILPKGTLFLACCRGGMRTVALKVLRGCKNINYVCGPHWRVSDEHLVMAFDAFLDGLVTRGEDPLTAIDRASDAAVDRKFMHWDREELETDLAVLINYEGLYDEIRDLKKRLYAVEKASGIGVKEDYWTKPRPVLETEFTGSTTSPR